jgi:hypothetical protein
MFDQSYEQAINMGRKSYLLDTSPQFSIISLHTVRYYHPEDAFHTPPPSHSPPYSPLIRRNTLLATDSYHLQIRRLRQRRPIHPLAHWLQRARSSTPTSRRRRLHILD